MPLTAGAIKFDDFDDIGRQVQVGEELLGSIVVIDRPQAYPNHLAPAAGLARRQRKNQFADGINTVLLVLLPGPGYPIFRAQANKAATAANKRSGSLWARMEY